MYPKALCFHRAQFAENKPTRKHWRSVFCFLSTRVPAAAEQPQVFNNRRTPKTVSRTTFRLLAAWTAKAPLRITIGEMEDL